MRRDVALRLLFYLRGDEQMADYIYSIRKNGQGYIGLASGSATSTDYQRTLGTRLPLDRMLQHIDNAYGLKNTYQLAKGGDVASESSMDLDKALKEGAYTCQFSYNDDEASCFGVGIQYFEQFNAI